MDKYEFNIKVEQIKKLVSKSDYETAMKITDTIDWKRVRNTNLLSMVAMVYEKNEEYQEAKDILLLAFERAPIGKRLLYKLGELALKEGNVSEAEAYYREFCDLASDDPRQYLLRYLILQTKNAPIDQLIHSLERYINVELDEKWLYELAELYHKAGNQEECIKICDRIMLMFGLGQYVDKAMELKMQYAPLTQYQMDLVENRDKYEAKLRAVEEQYGSRVLEPEQQEEDYEDSGKESVSEDKSFYQDEMSPEENFPPEENLPPEAESLQRTTLESDLVVRIKEAEVEERLAKELSKISIDDCDAEESPLEQTRIFANLKDFKRKEESESPVLMQQTQENTGIAEAALTVEPLDEDEVDLPLKTANHLMIEANNPQMGLELALESLKQIHSELGVSHTVAKITGAKLNKKGVLAVADKLLGKDLIVEQAADLSQMVLDELNTMMEQDTVGTVVVLIDSKARMEMMHRENPSLASKFECIGSQTEDVDIDEVKDALNRQVNAEESKAKDIVSLVEKEAQSEPEPAKRPEAIKPQVSKPKESVEAQEMDLDEFAQYACKYAGEIDCSITGKSMLALYERIEIMEEDDVPLTRDNAELLIEEAADKAEKPSIAKLITGVFSAKYDKDGLLILKEEHFID